MTAESQPLLPDLDLAYDEVPDLHERIDCIGADDPVVAVRYHGHSS